MSILRYWSEIQWRILGMYGPGGITNVNDHWAGLGVLTKDFQNYTGYWYISGWS
jgi:hypothetical protein